MSERHYCNQAHRLKRIETAQDEHRAEHREEREKDRKAQVDLASQWSDGIARMDEAARRMDDATALLRREAKANATMRGQIRKLFAMVEKLAGGEA